MTRCATCGGAMIPAPFKGDPNQCLCCGRTGIAPVTPETAAAIRREQAAIERGETQRGTMR